MNEAAFEFETFSAKHPRKDEKTIWFLSALPRETDRDWSKTHLQIRGNRCCQGPHNSPSGRPSYMRMTWTVSRSSNDLSPSLLLSLYVLLFVSSLKSSVNFSVSGFAAPCDPENVVDVENGTLGVEFVLLSLWLSLHVRWTSKWACLRLVNFMITDQVCQVHAG